MQALKTSDNLHIVGKAGLYVLPKMFRPSLQPGRLVLSWLG